MAEKPIAKGEPVYISYGSKCNSRFFLHYGFIYDNNEANGVTIKLKLDKDDELYTAKLGIIGAN